MTRPPDDRSGRGRPNWRVACVFLALLAAAMVLWWVRPPTSPLRADPRAAPAAVARTNLALLAGRLCLLGQTNPFTGLMIEHAADGSLRSRSAISNGLLQGLSEGWATNGQLQVTEHFKEGVSHGVRTKWHPNGVKLSEGSIVEAKFQGTFRRWTETGFLAEQIEFADGQPQGLSLAYYPSGFLKTRLRMERGQVVEKQSWPDGAQKDSFPAGNPPRVGAGL